MLLLGSFLFQDFEIPENVRGLLSGKQMLAAKKLIGGQRVIDAMGPDPDDISWSGRFQGGDVVSRAQQIADMRDTGQTQSLVCDLVVLTVLIADFKFSYERPYQATYEITVMVLPDQIDSGGDASLDSLVGSDMTMALSFL